jgi:hypothetical protein
MRKVVILGCFFAVFLLLMVPNVNSIEYNQVSNNITENISLLTERISRLLKRANEKQLISLNKLIDITSLRIVIDKITNNGDGICLSCEADISRCLDYLIHYLSFMLLALFLIIHILLWYVYLLVSELAWELYYVPAKGFGCLWTKYIHPILFHKPE